MNRPPCRYFLIDTRSHERRLSIHERFDRCAGRRRQQILDRHDPQELVLLADDEMARAFVSMTNQTFAHLTDTLKWCRHRDAGSGVLSGGFEGQLLDPAVTCGSSLSTESVGMRLIQAPEACSDSALVLRSR